MNKQKCTNCGREFDADEEGATTWKNYEGEHEVVCMDCDQEAAAEQAFYEQTTGDS